MPSYISPLSIVFIWHPADASTISPIAEHCFSLLSRDVNKPFSRSMNLPVFFRTTFKKGVPLKINSTSEQTIAFIFIGKEIVADELWIKYIEDILKEDIIVIPIAMDSLAFKLNCINEKNFIRAYTFNPLVRNDYLFIAITHEIYRWALNKSFDKKTVGKDNAVKIFLSHAKDGKNGIKIAENLKKFIDNSPMRNFFDATDIAPSYKFDDEIMQHIQESTIIAIHSDIYSSRYWCQREILCAKENNRPIIAIDTLEEFEDRRFPFASNIPGIHLHISTESISEKDLLRILSLTLLETVRFFYSEILLEKYKSSRWLEPKAKVLSRPPEVADIEKIISCDGKNIKCNYESIVYPEPPLYAEELRFLNKLGIEIHTPLTINSTLLDNVKIGISISEPSIEELINIGHTSKHLILLSQDIARHLLARNAILIYGGDLRQNGFTEFIFDEAEALQIRLQSKNIQIKNYIAWPIYKNDNEDIKFWKAKYRPIAQMIEVLYPEDVKDLIINEDCFLPPTNPQNIFVWSRCLTLMREKMIADCDARICAGGKHSGYKGKIPGVLEEIIIALRMKRPLFLLGGFGGVTADVCRIIQDKALPQEFTQDWQIQNNAGYKELLDIYSARVPEYSVNYSSLIETIKNANLNNGLNEEENARLFTTPFIDEAMNLVFKGFKNLSNKMTKNRTKR